MNKLTDRIGWDDISQQVRLWIVWFLRLLVIGVVLEVIIPNTFTDKLIQWLAITIICVLASSLIIRPSKKKLNEEEE